MLQEQVNCVKTVSETDVKRLLSEYFHSCVFEQSNVGFSNVEEPWKKEPIVVNCGEVLFRVLEGIENCVLLFSTESGKRESWMNASQGFGGVFVGSLATSCENETPSYTVEVFGELIVLYSTAILISRYEKELSKRVLHDCENSVIDAVKRKLNGQRDKFEKQSSPNVSNTVISVDESDCEIVTVDFTNSYSQLCDWN